MKKLIFVSTIVVLVLTASCYNPPNLPDIGDGYKLDRYKYSLAIVNSQNTIMISDRILDYAFDSTFILTAQRPWDVPDIPGIKEMTYKERNEAFEKSTFRQYWIINKKEKNKYVGYTGEGNSMRALYSNVYGPFNKEEYLQKREKLGVPQQLQLREI